MNKFFFYSLFILPSISYAFFCPTNFTQINFGATIAQVTEACGKPDAQSDSKKSDENVPQEWSYYVPQTVAQPGMQKVQGTLKTQLTFDNQGRAINISVNGLGVGATTICGGKMIRLGDTRETVEAACGEPSFINKGDSNSAGPVQETNITTFIYNTNPPTKLIFENGVLTQKQ